MRKFVSVLVFLVYLSVPAQQETNPFAAAENESNETGTKDNGQKVEPSTANSGGGNPGDPTPIDDYIPFLLLTGVGIIVYTTYRKKQMTKS